MGPSLVYVTAENQEHPKTEGTSEGNGSRNPKREIVEGHPTKASAREHTQKGSQENNFLTEKEPGE